MLRQRNLLLADTPNLYKSAINKFGPRARVDYAAARDGGLEVGPTLCEAIVNDGVSAQFVTWLQQARYAVTLSHAADVDEMLITRAIVLHRHVDCVVIASGDGKNIELLRILKQVGKRTVVAAIEGSIHRGLAEVADAIVPFPLREARGAELGADVAALLSGGQE